MPRPQLVRDQRTALALGIGLSLAGMWMLREAYEHRGKPRPFLLSFLPG